MNPSFTPRKHRKTLRFSEVFMEHRKGALGTNGLTLTGLALVRINFHGFHGGFRKFCIILLIYLGETCYQLLFRYR